jgi:hypothetical protein
MLYSHHVFLDNRIYDNLVFFSFQQHFSLEEIYNVVFNPDNLKKYELWDPKFESYIQVVIGDLTKPNLGIGEDEWLSMSSCVQTVFHLVSFIHEKK